MILKIIEKSVEKWKDLIQYFLTNIWEGLKFNLADVKVHWLMFYRNILIDNSFLLFMHSRWLKELIVLIDSIDNIIDGIWGSFPPDKMLEHFLLNTCNFVSFLTWKSLQFGCIGKTILLKFFNSHSLLFEVKVWLHVFLLQQAY